MKDESDAPLEDISSLLRAQADCLDAATRSRLNRSRQTALAELESGRRRGFPGQAVRLTALASLCVVAIVAGVWQINSPTRMAPSTVPVSEVRDLELLMLGEELEMLEELSFYDWMQSVPTGFGPV